MSSGGSAQRWVGAASSRPHLCLQGASCHNQQSCPHKKLQAMRHPLTWTPFRGTHPAPCAPGGGGEGQEEVEQALSTPVKLQCQQRRLQQ